MLIFSTCQQAIQHFKKPHVDAPGYAFVDMNLPVTSGDDKNL